MSSPGVRLARSSAVAPQIQGELGLLVATAAAVLAAAAGILLAAVADRLGVGAIDLHGNLHMADALCCAQPPS